MPKGVLGAKSEENLVSKQIVKNCKKQCFSSDFCKIKKKRFARVGTISRDGRVTGNKHIFCLGLRYMNVLITCNTQQGDMCNTYDYLRCTMHIL